MYMCRATDELFDSLLLVQAQVEIAGIFTSVKSSQEEASGAPPC